MNNIQKEKIDKLNKINDIMLEERSYLNVVKSFCENEMINSEQISDIYRIIQDICEKHEELITTVDDTIINFVNVTGHR